MTRAVREPKRVAKVGKTGPVKRIKKVAKNPPTPRMQAAIRQVEEKVRAEQAKRPMTKKEVEQLRQQFFREILQSQFKHLKK